MNDVTPAIVLGGTGYVAGELLRLIAGHPQLEVAAILSDSQPGAPVAGPSPVPENFQMSGSSPVSVDPRGPEPALSSDG